ncbi:2OG-Fe(II) oxygenase [Pelagerythrobacter marensis]|uniref:2OG-Fe(II) oxygenase n=2 Tax=Pelagerythrobacter marensis TaxID=543877 RepID=A0A0G3X577_9SPHN|nr:2OG-Fe(II) oxygenase [Pelagerythrobacter marensis]
MFRLFSGQMQNDLAPVRPGAMFDQKQALPCAERQPAIDHRNRMTCAGQRGLEMGGHIVRPLVIVIVMHPLGREPVEPAQDVPLDRARRVLVYQQRGGSMAAERSQQAGPHAGARQPVRGIGGYIVHAGAGGLDSKRGGEMGHCLHIEAMPQQIDLFASTPVVSGLRMVTDAVDPALERALEQRIDAAPLQPFQFGQWRGKRLTANFGSGYDYRRGRVADAPPLPTWIEALRERLTPLVGRDSGAFVQALLIRYDPGAGIGWHRDRPQYGEVIGLSLSAPAVLRLRRRTKNGFERRKVELPPRSLYLLSGEARTAWEHSIAPMAVTRRSVTLRTLR